MPSDLIRIPCVPLNDIGIFFIYMTCGTSGTQVTSIFFDGIQGIDSKMELEIRKENRVSKLALNE